MTALSLDDLEDEIEEVQKQVGLLVAEKDFCLVGYFITASIIHFLSMRSTLENLWHLARGVEILDLGKKRFLFKIFHWMDMDQVIKGVPWTFNNHLLVLNTV